jgi:hypothetical protein
MASTSEVGHAKNIANLNLLNNNIQALGSIYDPTNPILKMENLHHTYTISYDSHVKVNNLMAPYSLAVDDRTLYFAPLNRQLTKLKKAYKATEGVTPAQVEDLTTILRKLKGERKTKSTATTDTTILQASHSTSQMSYDQRTNNMDGLISLLQNTPNYNPNEQEYKIETYINKKETMLAKTQAVNNTFIPLNNARNERNKLLYMDNDNLVDVGNKAKDYLFSILDINSVQYKAIAKIKFRKI